MKFNILLSILFTIVTTQSILHDIEHITHEHLSETCEIIHINNLTSPDIVVQPQYIESATFENITKQEESFKVCCSYNDNQNRAPPVLS